MNADNKSDRQFDFDALRSKLEPGGGRRFWRGLDELAETSEFRESLDNEFPPDPASGRSHDLSRRDALKLMAASAAFAGLSACTKMPDQKIVPYVRAPEEFVPGKALFYATSMPLSGSALGLLVESHMGRPTKVEGNPDHPGSLGATDVFAQASVLTLYDPDRSQVVLHEGRIASWANFLTVLTNVRDEYRARKGAGLRLLTETVTSPSLASQIGGLLAEFPAAQWHQYEPCNRDPAHEGARLAFGRYLNTIYHLDKAEVILSLDADFLCSGPGGVRYARDFSARRQVANHESRVHRLYVVETTPSNTGAIADHRLALAPREIESFARAMANALGVSAGTLGESAQSKWAGWFPGLVRDLESHRGACVVVAGEHQAPLVHAIAHAMNQALGNVGRTIAYTEPIAANPVNQMQSLRQLVTDMKAGQVDTLLMLGGNPVFTAPRDLAFAEQLLKIKLRIHLSLYQDETSELCHWHVPEAHYLESWSDARAYDGSAGIVQPLIAPLYNGKTAHELLGALLGHPDLVARDLVRDHWISRRAGIDAERFWEASLEKGVLSGTALPPTQVSVNAEFLSRSTAASSSGPNRLQPAGELQIVFRPDPTIWDGRFANNGWLQELPKPITKLTWDNVAVFSPRTAQRLGINNEDVVELRYRGHAVRGPAWIMPGQADECVTVHLGYGRKRAGRVGNGAGFNAYSIRTSDAPWSGEGLEVQRTGALYSLARTQNHQIINTRDQTTELESGEAFRRDLVRVATVAEFRKNPDFAKDPKQETSRDLTLYPGHPYTGNAWGMAIDLNRCVGCNACVVACQAENNIPVVGKAEVIAGRAMHWIRIDTYFRGPLENPETYFEPVLCMHCENAPCELVCPVAATVHSPEGLNEMVYNRCVGTRYCSNNCPYKVRRFNFKLYSDWMTPSLRGLRNPNVTVRSRGVMEKCTYCVQRINAAKIEAEKQNRAVRDGEIVTACQAACPTEAIVFGNINDPNSRVSKLKAESRNYGLLTELNTRPRTTYLARLRNPTPEIKE